MISANVNETEPVLELKLVTPVVAVKYVFPSKVPLAFTNWVLLPVIYEGTPDVNFKKALPDNKAFFKES